MKKELMLCFALLCFALPKGVLACWCKEISIEERYKLSDAIFIGTVIEITEDASAGYNVIRFKVDEWIQGVNNPEQEVRAYESEAGCGLIFNKNSEYVVFAEKNKKSKFLETTSCHLTRLKNDAKEDIIKLRELRLINEK